MKEMELNEIEEKLLRNVLHNHLIMSKQWVEEIKIQIEIFEDIGLTNELDQMRKNLKQAKENHKNIKQTVFYWKQKLDDLDNRMNVYIE